MDTTKYVNQSGLYFSKQTSQAIRAALVRAFESGEIVRIWYGDTLTGRAWPEEHDILGKIARSCGPVKVPLLVKVGEDGGSHMLDYCIVRIDTLRRRKLQQGESRADGNRAKSLLEGTTVYQHASFHAGNWEIKPSSMKDFKAEVYLDGQVHARFSHAAKAPRFVQFMQGLSYHQV